MMTWWLFGYEIDRIPRNLSGKSQIYPKLSRQLCLAACFMEKHGSFERMEATRLRRILPTRATTARLARKACHYQEKSPMGDNTVPSLRIYTDFVLG
mmetsp:Transcript_8709/g.18571  ORF Transcript_8709/g.18571 Transcript_8709/m.18571 type:complete len:97 (-) Transcript_8709:342-632(-)